MIVFNGTGANDQSGHLIVDNYQHTGISLTQWWQRVAAFWSYLESGEMWVGLLLPNILVKSTKWFHNPGFIKGGGITLLAKATAIKAIETSNSPQSYLVKLWKHFNS